MNSRKLRVPVICPNCGAEQLAELSADRIAKALREGRPVRLHSSCHDRWWSATYVETEQVRQYLGATSLHHEQGRPILQRSQDTEVSSQQFRVPVREHGEGEHEQHDDLGRSWGVVSIVAR
jgi:hypothetical protein